MKSRKFRTSILTALALVALQAASQAQMGYSVQAAIKQAGAETAAYHTAGGGQFAMPKALETAFSATDFAYAHKTAAAKTANGTAAVNAPGAIVSATQGAQSSAAEQAGFAVNDAAVTLAAAAEGRAPAVRAFGKAS